MDKRSKVLNGLVQFPTGKRWYKNGKLHREDGPAIDSDNGDEEWFFEGKHHRADGPAYISLNGKYKEWWVNNKMHRIDGPAVEYSSGDKEWYYNGQYVKCSSQEEFEKFLKLKAFI